MMQLQFFISNNQQNTISFVFLLLYYLWLTYRIVKRGNQKKITPVHKLKIYLVVFLVVSVVLSISLMCIFGLVQYIYDCFGDMSVGSLISILFSLIGLAIVTFSFGGIVLYATGRDMERFKKWAFIILLMSGLPLLIFLIDISIIRAFFIGSINSNVGPLGTFLIVLVFVSLITLVLYVVVKWLWINPAKRKRDLEKE